MEKILVDGRRADKFRQASNIMRHIFFSVALAALLLAATSSSKGQTGGARNQATTATPFAASPRLQRIVDDATREALERFKDKGLAEKNLAVTLVDLTNPQHIEQASFRGEEQTSATLARAIRPA